MSYPQQCFWLTMTAWWQRAVSRTEALVIVTGEMLSESQRAMQPMEPSQCCGHLRQHDGSMLSPVRNTIILQCFDAVGWATGRASGL